MGNKPKEVTETKPAEETPEPEVIIQEVKVPIPIEDLSEKELDEFQAQIEEQKINNHLKAEEQKIKDVACPVCNKKLGLKPGEYMKLDNKAQVIECPKCERLITCLINYNEDPSISNADITLKTGGFAWETQHPSLWEDKHAQKWAQEEANKMAENKGTLSLEGQKLFRVMQLSLKKQKIIK